MGEARARVIGRGRGKGAVRLGRGWRVTDRGSSRALGRRPGDLYVPAVLCSAHPVNIPLLARSRALLIVVYIAAAISFGLLAGKGGMGTTDSVGV